MAEKGSFISFSEIKRAVSARAAGEMYGLHPNRNGKVCCPFHPDKTPSMKLDERFHCFGCGADGDAIDLTAKLFGLTLKDAAVKLKRDFGLTGITGRAADKKKSQEAFAGDLKDTIDETALVKRKFDQWIRNAQDTLLKYVWQLREWKELYAPREPTDEWHPLFCEALRQETIAEYYLDLLAQGSKEEQIFFYKEKRGEVTKLEKRLEQCKSGSDQ